jgi:hypothetical protein
MSIAEQIIQRLNSILERNSDRKVNQLIPEDIRQLKISIKELEQRQSLPIDSDGNQRELLIAFLNHIDKGMGMHNAVDDDVYVDEYLSNYVENKGQSLPNDGNQRQLLINFISWVGDGYDFEKNAEKITDEYINKN